MDTATRRNHKKGNKENTQPACRSKSLVKREVTKPVAGSVAPFHLKSNEKEGTLAKDALQKVMPKQGGMTLTSSGDALKKPKTVQGDGRGGTGADAKKRQTLSRAFLTEQAARQRKLVAEAPQLPAAVPPSKSAPGLYKGRVVESKIGSIWKFKSSSVEGMDQKATAKPSAPATGRQQVGNLTKARSKSVVELPKRGTQKSQPTRSKSVCDGPAPVSKRPIANRPVANRPIANRPTANRPITNRPMTAARSAVPPARAISATLPRPSSSTSTVMPKGKGTQSKPRIPVVTDKTVNKLPVSSTLSQYRLVSTETAEERKAKLAEWLATKGKTLKRPAMATTAPPPKTKVAVKPNVQLKPQAVTQVERTVEPQPAVQCEDEFDVHGPVAQPEDNQKPEQQAAHASTPLIMNTTMELLDNSLDLPVDPEARMNDIVVNLCDALDAMEPPSACEDEEPQQMNDESDKEEMEDSTPKDECQDEVKSESSEEVIDEPEDVEVDGKGEEESYSQRVKKEEVESNDYEDDDDDDDDDDDCEEILMETTPEKEEASVVKYSVMTTPYLKSVKKTIDDEASASGSRRKSTIKDLKFLTPVRRSCRIQRNSSLLPGMLADHDPCVSSLAELVHLDDDAANAYIYRRNPALLGDLPDDPADL